MSRYVEPTKPTKFDLLAHYEQREPTRFIQWDCHKCDGWDYVLQPDEHGHAITCRETHELMVGPAVRVLIQADAGLSKSEVVDMLLKLAYEINHNDYQFDHEH